MSVIASDRPDLRALRITGRGGIAIAIAAFITFAATGHLRNGLAFSLGLGLGTIGTRFITMLLENTKLLGPAGFGFASILKLGFLTICALAIGAILGGSVVWLALIGLGLAQLLLAISSAYALARNK